MYQRQLHSWPLRHRLHRHCSYCRSRSCPWWSWRRRRGWLIWSLNLRVAGGLCSRRLIGRRSWIVGQSRSPRHGGHLALRLGMWYPWGRMWERQRRSIIGPLGPLWPEVWSRWSQCGGEASWASFWEIWMLSAEVFVAIYVEVARIPSWRLIAFYAFFLCSNYRRRLVPNWCGSFQWNQYCFKMIGRPRRFIEYNADVAVLLEQLT